MVKKADFGAACLVLALVLIIRLTPFDEPLVLLELPLMLAAYLGGLRAGLIATATATIAMVFFLVTPVDSFSIETVDDLIEVAALALGGVTACVLCEMLHRARRRAESSERMYSESFHANPTPIALFRIDGECADANPAFLALTGCTRSELGARADVRAVLDGSSKRDVPTQIVGAGGEARDVTASVAAVEPNGVPHLLAMLIDVTERNRAELRSRELSEALHQSQKMESLGRLAGGVAHDFNNILAIIAMSSSALVENLPADGEDVELVREIDDAVDRATALTKQLLAFSRKQTSSPTVLDVATVVDTTRRLLRRVIREDIEMTVSHDAGSPRVRMDEGRLGQVLMNLAINARDAMPRGGVLTIRTTTGTEGTVALAISDTGSGMTDEVRARVFEPFFTTKPVGKGTGMGLAVVHGIVHEAGGRISIDSSPGVGTTVTITLPTVDLPVTAGAAPRTQSAHGNETLLVVDDDASVRRATVRALASYGYRVIEAADSRAAMGSLESTHIDLLVTDVVMPGVDGRGLAEMAMKVAPELTVLFTSGYPDDEIVQRGVMAGTFDLVAKPFRPETIAMRARAALDRRAAKAQPV